MAKNTENTKRKEALEEDLQTILKRPEIKRILKEEALSRAQKIEELKRRISEGNYSVPSEQVARAIISHAVDKEDA